MWFRETITIIRLNSASVIATVASGDSLALTRQIRSIFEAEVHVLFESIMPVVYCRDCQRHVRRCQTVGVNANRYRYSRQIYREIVEGVRAGIAIQYDIGEKDHPIDYKCMCARARAHVCIKNSMNNVATKEIIDKRKRETRILRMN